MGLIFSASALVLTFVVAYGLPGRLLVDLLVPDAEPDERFPFALALGLTVVNVAAILLVGVVGLFRPVYLVGPVMGAVVGGVLLVLLALRLWRRGRDFRGWFRRPSRTEVALLALTAAATAVFLVHYDKDLLWEESCMVRASSAAHANLLETELLELHAGGNALSKYQRDPQAGQDEGTNNFLAYNQGEPLGPTILLAPFLALFGQFGYRVLYVLQALLLPWAGFLLGRRLFGRPSAGWVTALLLTFSPYALAVRTYDENFFASAFGAVALLLLLRPRLPLVAAAIVLSSYVGVRQPLVLMLPFVLWYLCRVSPRPGRALVLFVSTMVLAATPYLVKHTLFVLVQHGTLFEGAFERPQAPHSFLGLPFELPVLLGFPFVPEPARSPYSAYPTLVAFPLDLLQRFGYALAALVPLGLVRLFRADRRATWLLVAWVAPLLALLMVQSNWVEPNKMGVPATALAPMVLVIVAGGLALLDGARSWASRAGWLALGVALPLAFVAGVRDYRAPVDARVFGYPSELYDKIFSPGTVRVLDEDAAYIDWDRQRLQPGLFPDWHVEAFRPALLARSLERLADAIARPGFEHYDRAMPDELVQTALGQGMVMGPLRLLRLLHGGPPPSERLRPLADVPPATLPVILDLGAPLVGPPPLRLGEVDGPVVVPGGSEPTIVTGLRVPWADHEVSLLAARDDTGVVFLFLMPGRAAETSLARRVDVTGRQDLRLALRLAQGDRVRLIDVRVIRPARWYARWVVLGANDLWTSPPRALSPS